jgi:hypothetical protein
LQANNDAGPSNVAVVYLDQNKWIALARAVKYPAENPKMRTVLELLVEKRRTGQVLLPLASANIYETQKTDNLERRFDVAYCQTTLSDALFFRGRHKRLEVEIIDAIRTAYDLPALPREQHWFLSDVFLEATSEWDDPRLAEAVPEKLVAAIRGAPKEWLFRYIMETPETIRAAAVRSFSAGSEALRQSVEELRARDANEGLSMRRKIKNARLMINELELIRTFVAKAGVPDVNVDDILFRHARTIMNATPTYFIEREITLRLDAQRDRPIHENDFRDMQTFCTVVPYADIVVAEKQFTSLACQAGLDRKFGTVITPDLGELTERLV